MDIDLIKILVVLPFFLVACVTDIRERIVPNKLWIPLIIIAIIFLFLQITQEYLVMLGISLVLTLIIIVLMALLGFGGADLKAIIVIALLFPVYPETFNPIISDYSVFVTTTIINSLLIALVYPIAITSINIVRGDTDKPYLMFQAIKKPIKKVNQKERVWHNNKFKSFSPKELEILKKQKQRQNKKREEQKKEKTNKDIDGASEVWVTPWIPFIIFITAGLVTAIVLGDLLYIIFGIMV